MKDMNQVSSSFRDPAGFVFVKDGTVYRQINKEYEHDYRKLMDSGLYEALTKKKWLVCHEEVDITRDELAYKIIRPQQIPFISYSYEWCFSQLKDAALLTLDIQELALRFGMSLKDSSSYNIQFLPKPIFIDTTSFEEYEEGSAWVGYRQFCRHFLAPLALMSRCNIYLNKMLTSYIDGIPLDLASSLLPARTKFNISLLSHIHLHAKSESFDGAQKPKKYKVSKLGLLGIIDNLRSCVKRMQLKKAHSSIWSDYYEKELNYSDEAFTAKKEIVAEMLKSISSQSVVDLGANRGIFSRVASEMGIFTISSDIDPIAVERNYLEAKAKKRDHLLPLVVDITNPSPGIGWENEERESFFTRAPETTALALALIHHLVIANNLPFGKVAAFFSRVCQHLIIEFVPKSDSQVERMLRHRKDIFGFYTADNFEADFAKEFTIKRTVPVEGSNRVIYLMERK
ncbi:SAM-dependent methyltransferase [Candidatus Uabimicrobium amorphum]|uniref:Nodulation protein NoeA n=1 Tax=Uabimicrobium amorphum TaxID=2596890 RepID=A0A5S9IMM1_UABAM|nr:SAM-dependent methyltransferase [Candidatus Uabimicrobium amorphum]BBM84131.1 Nodulation protein NoeA [Candidatus Uabimicrobium amorphum]